MYYVIYREFVHHPAEGEGNRRDHYIGFRHLHKAKWWMREARKDPDIEDIIGPLRKVISRTL